MQKKIKVGSLVKLQKGNCAHDEWIVRGYDKLIGVVVAKWENDDEYDVVWQGKGRYYDGESEQRSWVYDYCLELVQ
jgi:hypothetical protein